MGYQVEREVNEHFAPFYPYVADEVLAEYGREVGRVLEIGPYGPGVSIALAKKCPKMTFVCGDEYPEALAYFRECVRRDELIGRVEIQSLDKSSLVFDAEIYDLVIFRGGLFFLGGPGEDPQRDEPGPPVGRNGRARGRLRGGRAERTDRIPPSSREGVKRSDVYKTALERGRRKDRSLSGFGREDEDLPAARDVDSLAKRLRSAQAASPPGSSGPPGSPGEPESSSVPHMIRAALSKAAGTMMSTLPKFVEENP